jgi:DHA1 family bicyclomycin/chloramphenicol resistance-like MFS transporter
MNRFGLSEDVFGYYFGFNALGFMLGSLACTRLAGVYKPLHMLYFTIGTFFLGGVLMLVLGGDTPYTVAAAMICITFSVGFSRPISNSMILDQVDTDVGAASGILTFEIFMIAAVAMQLISLDWADKPMLIGMGAMISALVPLAALQLVKKRCRF